MSSKAKKGSSFERELAIKLSLWWTNGERSDVFWRTAGSGARARVRGKKGQQTQGQHGDIGATHPIGDPLTKVTIIEVKRGYSRATIQDLVDFPEKGSKINTIYGEWFRKAKESQEQSGSISWMLIHKRDRREALVFMPKDLWYALYFTFDPPLKAHTNVGWVVAINLDDMLRIKTPETFKHLAERDHL